MRLAFLLILAVASLAVLIRAYFSRIDPFGIVRVAIGRLPGLVREQPLVVATAFLPFLAAPLGTVISQAAGEHWALRALTSLAWQSLWSGLLALVAVRVHRRIIFRDHSNRILIGRRERRMALYVVSALVAIALVRLVPYAAAAFLGAKGAALSLAQAAAFCLSWALVVLFAYVGPSASFDDPAPFAVSRTSVVAQPIASVTLVLVSQLLLGMIGLAMTSVVVFGQLNLLLIGLVAIVAVAAMVATFLVAETAMAIALTRIRENVYDDTRAREYNADWH